MLHPKKYSNFLMHIGSGDEVVVGAILSCLIPLFINALWQKTEILSLLEQSLTLSNKQPCYETTQF